ELLQDREREGVAPVGAVLERAGVARESIEARSGSQEARDLEVGIGAVVEAPKALQDQCLVKDDRAVALLAAERTDARPLGPPEVGERRSRAAIDEAASR